MDCRDDLTSIDLDHSTASESLTSTSTSSSSISLFPFLDLHQSYGTNLSLPSSLPRILRPLDTKDVCIANEDVEEEEDELRPRSGGNWQSGSVESQEGDDDEILVHIKFTELVKIKSILIGTGGGRSLTSPQLLKTWVNQSNHISFSDVDSTPSSQEFELLESSNNSRSSTEYPVRLTKFSNVSSLDLYFGNSKGGDQSRLFYLGFMGESRSLKKEENGGMTVGAETGVDSMVDGMKESKPNGLASVR